MYPTLRHRILQALRTIPTRAIAAGTVIIFAATQVCAYPTNKAHARPELPKAELKQLNKTMKAAYVYDHDYNKKLDSITAILHKTPHTDFRRQWTLCDRLASAYLPVRADSALTYSSKALDIAVANGLEEEALLSQLDRINALSTMGMFVEGMREFSLIKPAGLPQNIKIEYFSTGRRLYGYMRAMVEGETQFFSDYTAKYKQYNDSLESLLPEGQPLKIFLQCEHMVNSGRYAEAEPILTGLLKRLPESNNVYGMAAFQLAMVYYNSNDPTTGAAYLAKAAISDIKGPVKDGLALPALAYWLYEQGELNDAFRYINFALEDATSGNARIRTMSIASRLPIIDEAYRQKISSSRDELMIFFLLALFLLVISGILLSVLMRQIKRSSIKSKKLARTSRLQETYIGNFISLSSTYANRLQSLQQLVNRKIAAGQADELQKIVNSGKFNDDLTDKFNEIFDSAFLDIYPDFIEDVNALLKPEERIEVKDPKVLTPELRIYAFVRLGVEESTRISQILNYSVSTVYAYRNRMRNKATDRENFDSNIKKLLADK